MQKIQEFIVSELAQQKSHLFLWVPVCFALGIGVYFGLDSEPPWYWAGLLSVAALGLVFWLFRQQDNAPVYKAAFIGALGLFLTFAGFSAAQIRTGLVYTPMIVKKISPVGVEGTIEKIEPLGGKDGSRVILSDVVIERIDKKATPKRVRLKIRKDEGLQAGQRVKLLAGLNPPSPPVAPHAFDFQRMAFFQGIGAVGFSYNAPEILQETSGAKQLETIRQKISGKINSAASDPQAAILIALTTGQRSAIREEDREALRGSGLAHLLAISGLHVGMVAGVLFFFSRLLLACFPNLALHYPIKKWAAFIALIGALLYTLIVGATIPTQRALIMTGLMMAAIMYDRSPFSLRLVALAAFLVLLFSPESLTSVSFQMSFAAVVALICFYEYIRPIWMGMHRKAGILRRVFLYFAGVSLTTLIAGAATGLFALYHFQQYAMYGMLGNLIAVPLMAFIVMPLIVLSYVLMPFGVEGVILPFAEWGVKWILETAHWVANMDGAVWHVSSWPQSIFILMVLSIWIWMVWQGRLRHVALSVFALLIVAACFYKQPDMLISTNVDLVSVRNDDGQVWLSTGRKERYAADNWLRANGLEGSKKNIWPREGSIEGFPLTCDSIGCRGEIKGKKVAVSFAPQAWQEDCRWADLLISQTPVPYEACEAKRVIDYFDVWRSGAHAVWLSEEGIEIKTVENVRGKRPWAQTAANKRKD